jgi:hypothetical protein
MPREKVEFLERQECGDCFDLRDANKRVEARNRMELVA